MNIINTYRKVQNNIHKVLNAVDKPLAVTVLLSSLSFSCLVAYVAAGLGKNYLLAGLLTFGIVFSITSLSIVFQTIETLLQRKHRQIEIENELGEAYALPRAYHNFYYDLPIAIADELRTDTSIHPVEMDEVDLDEYASMSKWRTLHVATLKTLKLGKGN